MTILPHLLAETQNAVDKFFLPHPASNLARDVDWGWNFILGISTFFFCIVVGSMLFFVFKYRRRHPNQETSTITHNTPLEIMWTGIPLVVVLAIFFFGFKGFLNYDTPPSNAVQIDTLAWQWNFSFTYPNGASDSNLYLLKGTPYVLNIQSKDVLHAVYIPAFRTQRNAVPGRTTHIWFIPEEKSPMPLGNDPGGFDLFCTQYCGTSHSTMGARVYVYDNTPEGKTEYDKKMTELANPFKADINGKPTWLPYKQVGEKIYTTYCAQCHSNKEGVIVIGPSWKGLYKDPKGVQFSASNEQGFSLSASDPDEKWEAYLNESILHPEVKIVKGFQNQMTSFASQLSGGPIKDEKRRAVIEYIKSIGSAPYTPAADPAKNPELFDAKNTPLKDKDGLPIHPESLAAKNLNAPATSQNATQTAPK